MNILIFGQRFDHRTGAPLNSYELAREWVKMGHTVGIVGHLGDPLTKDFQDLGCECYTFAEYRGIEKSRWDVALTNQYDGSSLAAVTFPGKVIHVVHSELSYENPYLGSGIDAYISVKPSVTERLLRHYRVPKAKVFEVPIPVDRTRFNTQGSTAPARFQGLFCGTLDQLRYAAARQAWEHCTSRGGSVTFLGRILSDWWDREGITWAGAEHIDETPCPEAYAKLCTETFGVMHGRWEIEGWMCGKPSTCFVVDDRGTILRVERTDVPEEAELEKYSSPVVAARYLEIFGNV